MRWRRPDALVIDMDAPDEKSPESLESLVRRYPGKKTDYFTGLLLRHSRLPPEKRDPAAFLRELEILLKAAD